MKQPTKSSATQTNELTSLLKKLPFLDNIDPTGRRVFVRTDFNLPRDENEAMIDDGRLRAVLPTINYLLDRGASIVIGSHIRTPLKSNHGETSPDLHLSFASLARRLSRLWEVEVGFAPVDGWPESSQQLALALKPGQVLLLENLRFNPGETAGNPIFAGHLAALADIYVNDAFGVCHRAHASMTTITKFMKTRVAGLALKNELMALNRALSNPIRPLAAIIGGRDIQAKLPVLHKLLGLADYVLLGGEVGDITARLAQKIEVEESLCDSECRQKIEGILQNLPNQRAKLLLPIDAVAVNKVHNLTTAITIPLQSLTQIMISKDIGPATRLLYNEALALCRTIIWSGPMGAFETPAFSQGTASITQSLAECQGVTLAGGVNTSAAIMKMSNRSQISFISTGGSAFLRALAGQPLVALDALNIE